MAPTQKYQKSSCLLKADLDNIILTLPVHDTHDQSDIAICKHSLWSTLICTSFLCEPAKMFYRYGLLITCTLYDFMLPKNDSAISLPIQVQVSLPSTNRCAKASIVSSS